MDVIVLLYFYLIYLFDYLKIEYDIRVVFVCDNNCCVGFKNFFFEIFLIFKLIYLIFLKNMWGISCLIVFFN